MAAWTELDPAAGAGTEMLLPRGSGVWVDSGCLGCHEALEPMHPEAELSCVDCHGGDGQATKKNLAHVLPQRKGEGDERVADLTDDLAYRRFANPMDLRVAESTCGECHGKQVTRVHTSLHGSTAGHLSDGYYEMGLQEERGSRYSIFPIPTGTANKGGEIDQLVQVPAFKSPSRRDRASGAKLSTHFGDLARKECMQCHLWSEGRALRGRVGFDGDYRGQGCAACHVPYALDGLSESDDRSLNHNEPGHPRRHSMTAAPTTQTCTSCHYGDASIGLHFRGLSQLPPGGTGGPDIDGTTDTPLNRNFYINDASMTPPDVHHQRGMHCIDCHTSNDVMGDGKLHGQMEYAVEISCQDCHGSLDDVGGKGRQPGTPIVTERGTWLDHLEWQGDELFLKSKVDGKRHSVLQVADIVNPEHGDYNKRAAAAMTGDHGRLACYVCHNAWNINFLGFHFDRNESLTQQDLLSGRKTPGRVTTQEKVFATWKSFFAGWDSQGKIAPYLTGFSTMGTVRDKDGEVLLDQVMPETAAGLSGMTMIHHQMHTNRPTARQCVECHRSSTTWGMGSPNFRLGRQLGFVADRRGIEVVALQRSQLSASTPLAKFVLPDVVDIELECDPLQGHAQRLFATEGYRGLHVLDVRDPREPKRLGFVATVNPRGMQLVEDHLYLADGVGGLKVFNVSQDMPELVGQLPLFDAHEVNVQWPYAYVADGVGGLAIVDIRAPISPMFVSGARLNTADKDQDRATDVAVLFQYSRPRALRESNRPLDRRTKARNLCAVLDEQLGLVLLDVTEPTAPQRIYPRINSSGRSAGRGRVQKLYRGLELVSHVDLAESQGGSRTRERDLVYLAVERNINGAFRSQIEILDVSDPFNVQRVEQIAAGFTTEMVRIASFYNPPFLQTVAFSPGENGVLVSDLSVSAAPNPLGSMAGMNESYAIAVEEFPLDQMIGADGRRLKDVSHEGARWMYRAEVERVLGVSKERLGLRIDPKKQLGAPGATARRFFASLDKDRSGFLEDAELKAAGGARLDKDSDGRIALVELADLAEMLEEGATSAQTGRRVVASRVDVDGDLSRLLDGTLPYPFDRDEDRKLTRKELSRAFAAALDLNGDERLSMDELSRYPGATRELRYGGTRAQEIFNEYDHNRDGRIQPKEFRLGDDEWEAMDPNADGFCQLYVYSDPWWEKRGFVGPDTEWPTRQPDITYLPPVISLESLLASLDRDEDGTLTRKELKRRPELMQELDRDGDGFAVENEIAGRIRLVAQFGVDVSPDTFLERWDLNGDGEVKGAEVPAGAELRLK